MLIKEGSHERRLWYWRVVGYQNKMTNRSWFPNR